MMTIYELPVEVRDSFLVSYDLDEMALHKLGHDGLQALAGRAAAPEAVMDGFALRMAMIGVYSADTTREYEQDRRDYDNLAASLNERYGDIVILSDEPTAASALGLRGHRVPPFETVETGTKQPDGSFVVSTENLADQVATEDSVARARTTDNSR